MNKISVLAGRMVFWAGWPVLWIYLLRSTRTRIVVEYDGKILVLKNRLNNDRWSLPGGGLHRGEDPTNGVVRELYEETGITIKTTDVAEISRGKINHRGLRYSVVSFCAKLVNSPVLNIQRLEVAEASWLMPEDLDISNTSYDAMMIIDQWKQGR